MPPRSAAFAPLGIERAQPPHALADRRVRDEERREPFLHERVERPERLGRRARLELDELRRLLEPEQRVGEAVRRAAELGGGRSASNSRFGESSRCTHAAATGPSTKRSDRSSQPPMRLSSIDRRSEDDDGRLDRDVAVPDVRELVREHALELGRRTGRHEAGADRERRARGAASRRERARQAVGDEIEPRLHDPGARREPLDRRVEERRLRDRQLARADHPEHDPVERPVRAADEQQPREDEEREDADAAERPADEREHAADADQQEPRLERCSGRR